MAARPTLHARGRAMTQGFDGGAGGDWGALRERER